MCGLDSNTCSIGHSVGHALSFAKERLKTKLHRPAGLTAANSSHFHCLDRPEAKAHMSCMEGGLGGTEVGEGEGGKGRVALLRGDLD